MQTTGVAVEGLAEKVAGSRNKILAENYARSSSARTRSSMKC
jgi:hypothetical protein